MPTDELSAADEELAAIAERWVNKLEANSRHSSRTVDLVDRTPERAEPERCRHRSSMWSRRSSLTTRVRATRPGTARATTPGADWPQWPERPGWLR